jgi:hypothetical protein
MDNKLAVEVTAAVGTIAGAVFAAVAATASWVSARATQQATEAQLMASLMNEYSSAEMLKAIRELTEWADRYGDDFVNEIRRRGARDYFGPSRRQVSHYFQKVHRLWCRNLITRETVEALVDENQARLYINTLEPLEELANPGYRDTSFRQLGWLYCLQKRRLPPAA